MYKKVCEKFSKTKKSKNKDLIKDSLISFIKEIENVLDSPDILLKNKLFFSEFIEDPCFIFEINDLSIFNEEKVDTNISTDGIITELFNMCDISDSNDLSNKLKQSIFALHSKLSKGIIENDSEINTIRIILKNIKQKLSC
ncbi:MAG: hypothetical protein PHX25_01885 [Candidatus Pacebacteria bacterium]|nr:hypothetical protein [Candidatus Paceibacterota bacterium]